MLGAHRFGWQGGRVMLSNGNHLSTATGNGVVMNKISVNTSISSGNSSNGLLFGPQMDYGTFCNIYVEGNLQP
jgi:hypothetical protein